MESLYLLIPVSILFFVIALVAFFWAVNNGQYDDLDGEAERLLFEEKKTVKSNMTSSNVADDSSDPGDEPEDAVSKEQV